MEAEKENEMDSMADDINELAEAMEDSGDNLTWNQLFDLLGIKVNDHGIPLSMIEAKRACLNVQTNLAVRQLDKPARLQAIRTAALALDRLSLMS